MTEIADRILYEDNHLIAINKLAGELVQGDESGDRTLADDVRDYLKKKDYKTYVKIRYGILGQTMNLPGRPGRKVSSLAYSVARRLIGFN